MKSFVSVLALAFVFLLPVFSFAGDAAVVTSKDVASAAVEKGAKDFVVNLGDEALGLIKNKNLSESDKTDKLERLFRRSVDTEWMGRFAMGKYFRGLSDSQRGSYLNLYSDYLVMSYIPKFKKYTGQVLEIVKITPNNGEYLVQTNLKSQKSDEPNIRVDYRIKKNSGGYKVIDIIGEGISLITTQRSDFGGLISQKGNEYFITKLEEKVKRLKADS